MLDNIKNKIDYFIRSHTKFSRKNYSEKEVDERENMYVYDILTQTLGLDRQDKISVLDIGSKNWAYAKGEYNFFKQYCSFLQLDGVEIDAYRLYSNFYSRYEVAKFYIKDLEGANYYADNLLNINKKYDYIVWLLPFVTEYPLQKWGLPKEFFMPEKLLKHAYTLLQKEMLIINQGAEEAEIQKALLEKLNIRYKFLGILTSKALKYQNERYGFLVIKNQ